MLFDISSVTVFDADGVPSSGTPLSGEVPSGTPAAGTGDAAKLEEDRRKQQAVYDRMLAEKDKQLRELNLKLEQFTTQGMDDTARVAYERDQLKAKVAEIEAKQRVSEYADAFCNQFKIDKGKLDLTNEETIAQSGWAAVIERQTELEQKLAEFQANPTNPLTQKPTPQNTTKIITGSGGVPRTAMSQTEFMTQVAQAQGKQSITLEELFRWVESRPDRAEAYNQWLSSQATE